MRRVFSRKNISTANKNPTSANNQNNISPVSPPKPGNNLTPINTSAALYAAGSELLAFLAEFIAHITDIYSSIQSNRLESAFTSALTHLSGTLADFANVSPGVDLASYNRSTVSPASNQAKILLSQALRSINKVFECIANASSVLPLESDEYLEQVRLRLVHIRSLLLENVRHMI